MPLLVLAVVLGAYLAWHKLRKRPEKKRWSAVCCFSYPQMTPL